MLSLLCTCNTSALLHARSFQALWSFGSHPGVFVQLEAPDTRRVWFLEERRERLQDGVMLDEKQMAIMDPLYWSPETEKSCVSVELSAASIGPSVGAFKGGKAKYGKSKGGKCSKASAFGGH